MKYPLPLWSGHDCAILEGFGTKICEMLEQKLQKHLANSDVDQDLCFKDKITELRRRHCDEMLDLISSIEATNLIDNSVINEEERTNLSVIAEEDNLSDVEMLEDENRDQENEEPNTIDSDDSLDLIIRKYQPKERKVKSPILQKITTEPLDSPISALPKAKRPLKRFASFNTNVAGPSYASSPINRPITSKKIVHVEDELDAVINKYSPADTQDCFSPIIPEKRRKVDDILSPPKFSHPQVKETTEDEKKITVDDINPNDYEVILIIDIGEAKSKTSCEVQSKIKKFDVKSEVRKLHVGDFVWMASHKTDSSKKYVLPYIIERKRLDDLASSIKDHRFHEQKFRLKQCGIENVIYLVENMKASNYGLPFETLTQAISNTLIQNKFQVKFTDNSDHTVLYLAIMTNFIRGIFINKNPLKFKLLDFESFNQGSVKQKKCTVRETFIKQLLSLKGVSVDIALEITNHFPTPSHLFEKYSTLSQTEGENLLNKITIGDIKRKIPSTVSKIIYHFYNHK